MALIPARVWLWCKRMYVTGKKAHGLSLLLFFLLIFHAVSTPSLVLAQTPTMTPVPGAVPTPVGSTTSPGVWKFDTEVTEVGRNADRARQLLWWVWSHPSIYTAPVIAQLWGITRNIVYVLIVLVLVAFGVGIMLGRRQGVLGPIFSGISSPVMGMQIPSIFLRLGTILLYVTFSYVIVLGFIQFSEITMQFIRTLVGRDLFNVFFAGSGNIEDNYKTFVGYRSDDPLNLEMIKTSLFLINITSFTYNAMAVILILRSVILWFLLILSPFLAILMPFIFIRNVGWIWIGVFFQWLFYGPLMVLFVVAIVNIWVAGIPYAFDFSRVNTVDGQVYKTSINILYGGPAQTLSTGNSANYVDTYAEYVIALVMLWAAMILPWLLLRIFRDYCCSLLAAGNSTLTAIFDRLRQYPPPSPSPSAPSPTTTTGIAQQLPFRQRIDEKIHEYSRTSIANVREISNVSTNEIARAMDLSVSKLSDVSRLETNSTMRQDMLSRLDRIAAPERVASPVERQQYERLRTELRTRAMSGDKVAQTVLSASEKNREILASQLTQLSSQKTFAPAISFRMPSTEAVGQAVSSSTMVSQIAQETSMTHEKVSAVLKQVNSMGAPNAVTVKVAAQKMGIPEQKVHDVLKAVETAESIRSVMNKTETISAISTKSNVSQEKVREVLSVMGAAGVPTVANVKTVAEKTGVAADKVKEIVQASQAGAAVAVVATPSQVAQRVGVSEEKVKEVMTILPQSGVPEEAKVKEAAQKVGLEEKKVKEIMAAHAPTTGPVAPGISVEDYEEVKKMWLSHYRDAPVPETEMIKSREDWLADEEKKLTNISNLLSSPNAELRKQGLEQVAEILPFMLLGGFSDAETLTYVHAKLEAVRQTQTEAEMRKKIEAEVTKKMKKEDEETLVEVGRETKKEAAQAAHLEAAMETLLPEEPAAHSATPAEPVTSSVPSATSPAAPSQKVDEDQQRKVIEQMKQLADVSLASLSDLSRIETQKQELQKIVSRLSGIAHPETIPNESLRASYEGIREGLASRAAAGDMVAKALLTIGEGNSARLADEMTQLVKGGNLPVKTTYAALLSWIRSIALLLADTQALQQLAQKAHLSEQQVRTILTDWQTSGIPVHGQQPEKAAIYAVSVDALEHLAHDVLSVVSTPSSQNVFGAIAVRTNMAVPTVNAILSQVHAGTAWQSDIEHISRQTGVMQDKVREVITAAEQIMGQNAGEGKQTEQLTAQLSLAPDAVNQLVSALKDTPIITPVLIRQNALRLNLPEEKVRHLAGILFPAKLASSGSGVSLEEYESIKSMWVHYYRESPVEMSETVHDRKEWVDQEEKTLVNVSDMLVSRDQHLYQQGLEKVGAILPFILLGGVTHGQLLIYLRAKLVAARQIREELVKGGPVIQEETVSIPAAVQKEPKKEEHHE